jgi:hypothetical protein
MPLRQALAEAHPGPVTDPSDPSMSVVVRARMPAERAKRFAQLLKGIAQEFSDGAPDSGETFGLVAAVYVPDWSVPAEGEA